jgi:hypothetical protein
MNVATVDQPRFDVRAEKGLDPGAVLDLLLTSATLLFANGQSTRTMVAAVKELGAGQGFRASVFPRWGELTVRIEDADGSHDRTIAVEPTGVDMNKVVATPFAG